MKKIIKTILFVLVIFIFNACTHEKQTGTIVGDYVTVIAKNISLDPDKQLLLSDFVDKIDIIPLEFTDSCMLKDIKKVTIVGNNIFLIESSEPESVYRFDMHGNFLNRIGVRGQGPQEQIELLDFSINEEDKIVYLLDNAKQVVFCYDFNGQFIERIRINQYASKMEYKNGFFYFYIDQPVSGNNNYSLIIRNSKGEIENMYFHSKNYPINIDCQIFSKTSDNLIFHKPMNDTIYSLDRDTLKYAYYFDFGSLKFTKQEVEDIYTERIPAFQILFNKERISGIDNLFHVGKWIYFNSTYKIISFSFLYNTESAKLNVAARFWDDLEYMFYNNTFYGQTNDALIGVYETGELLNDIERFTRYEKEKYISAEKKTEQVQKMKTIMRGNNPEEMNPWLLIYHLKSNHL